MWYGGLDDAGGGNSTNKRGLEAREKAVRAASRNRMERGVSESVKATFEIDLG